MLPRNYTNTIIISAVNLVEGGGLSVLRKCVQEMSQFNTEHGNAYKIIVLVHSASLLAEYGNVSYIAYPLAKKSWLFRAFYEYICFYFVSLRHKPVVWLSLHDMTPNVRAKRQYVYMHNSAPFFQKRAGLALHWKFRLFVALYKYLYRLNVRRNTGIIVQQGWFRDKIADLCKVDKERIIVAYPEFKKPEHFSYDGKYTAGQFFYNSFPRDFKNFETICKACETLAADADLCPGWKVCLTIDGTENEYSRAIVDKYRGNPHIHFCGLLSREQCEDYYKSSECLIFPSLLETWGLPISEFKVYGKKMILADLPYAHEAASGADAASFFEPTDYRPLAKVMKSVIERRCEDYFSAVPRENPCPPFCDDWKKLFGKIMPRNEDV